MSIYNKFHEWNDTNICGKRINRFLCMKTRQQVIRKLACSPMALRRIRFSIPICRTLSDGQLSDGSAGCPRTVSPTGSMALNMYNNFGLSMSSPSDASRERTSPRFVGAYLTQGGGAEPSLIVLERHVCNGCATSPKHR
jgi:hypothetical protein